MYVFFHLYLYIFLPFGITTLSFTEVQSNISIIRSSTNAHIFTLELKLRFVFLQPSAPCSGCIPVTSVFPLSIMLDLCVQGFPMALFTTSACIKVRRRVSLIWLSPLTACRLRQGGRFLQTGGQMWRVRRGQLSLSDRQADAHQDA